LDLHHKQALNLSILPIELPLKKKFLFLILGLAAVFLNSCQTYYFANEEFNNAYRAGNFEFCKTWLEKHKPGKRSKTKFLYEANLGMINFIQNEKGESDKAFEQAFLLAEDYQKKAGENVAALLTNPKRITYHGERYELLMLNYFKAINQLKASNPESALIEARRLIRKLNVLQDQGKKNTYNSDGFISWMIGTVFETVGEINNAYIYYKKAFEAYQSGFGNLVKTSTPQQLKYDLIRSAYQAGFDAEGQMFETKTGLKNQPVNAENGTALLLWHRGLGPVKDENRITFHMVKGSGGAITFNNEELGYSIPFFLPPGENYNPNRFDNLKIITMALPKYVNRNWYWQNIHAKVNGQRYDFQNATNLEEIAKADLGDRMGRELATALGRLAIKQALQYAATQATETAVKDGKKDDKKKNEQADLAGSLVNLAFTIANTATEVADTRNWQTLPAGIEVLRVSVPPGKQTIQLEGSGKDGKQFNQTIELNIVKGETTVHTVHTF